MLNPPNIIVVGFYVDEYFAGLWVYENHQDPICTKIRAAFVVNFVNCPLLWVSKIQTYIDLSTQYSEYVVCF